MNTASLFFLLFLLQPGPGGGLAHTFIHRGRGRDGADDGCAELSYATVCHAAAMKCGLFTERKLLV